MRPTVVRLAAGMLCVAGVAATVGCSMPEEAPAGSRADVEVRMPGTGIADLASERSTPGPAPGAARNKSNCAGCGVIESMRTIDTREEVVGGCTVGDAAGMHVSGSVLDVGERRDLMTLADLVAGVNVGDQGAKRVRVTTRHQIVVRFRDGSRHVFNEETPRALRVGDRILVIGGTTGANG